MPFLASFLPGYGAVSVASLAVAGAATVGGAMTAGGRVTGAGLTSTIDGTGGTPSVIIGPHGCYRTGDYLAWVTNGGIRFYIGPEVITEAGVFLQGRGGFGLAAPPAVKTSNYTMALATDFFVEFDPTSGAITVSLPAASSANRQMFAIRKDVAHANAVTIDPAGAETIDGAATLVVPDNTTKWIQCDGTGWKTIGTF